MPEQTLFEPAQLPSEKFAPRTYQEGAINAAVKFYNGNANFHGIEILPTASGKSVVIANIAKELDGKTIVFQPSKEILEQNYAKFISYGFRASIYSASAGEKRIDKVTFATIGSVARKHYLFKEFKNIIVDECHLVNSRTKEIKQADGSIIRKGGMYYEFIKATENCKVLGLTATPYRLASTMEGAMLKFLTRTRPRIFSEVLYCVQNNVLFDNGYLAPLKYYSFDVIDRKMLDMNTSGTDFTDASIKNYYRKINFPKVTGYWANRILTKRRNILIFSSLIEDANATARYIPGAVVLTGNTPKLERERILANFKSGKIRCVINVGVLTTGFDFPALEVILMAFSTMSLAKYYQVIGRVMRPFTYPDGTKKVGSVIDLGGNIKFFGKIETMQVVQNEKGLYSIMNNGKHLTNVTFSKN